jgi:hypothetical protein
MQSARESGEAGSTPPVFRALKKRLLERQCRGCSSSSSRGWTLDTVVGPRAAKARLRDGRGAAQARRARLPADGLSCCAVRVGTGKSFLAQCVSGEIACRA